MEVFADLVPYTSGRDRRIANQIRCRPTEGHSDALGWKKLRGEAGATDKSQHQLRVKGVDKRRERGSAGEPLRSSRTAVPGTARPGRASDRVRRRRTGAAAGGRGKEKCRGCSGPAACRWAPRAERTPHICRRCAPRVNLSHPPTLACRRDDLGDVSQGGSLVPLGRGKAVAEHRARAWARHRRRFQRTAPRPRPHAAGIVRRLH